MLLIAGLNADSLQESTKVGYLQLTKDHPIDQSTLLQFKMSLDHFKKQQVKYIVLELDTPGGEVFAALKITQLLKKVQQEDHIPVIAYINNWAISAGAMLAYACQTIGIAPGASMGAAEPILMDGGGHSQPASEKVNSALRAEFANLASFWNRNPDLAEAMVDKDIILVRRDHQITRLDHADQIRKDGRHPDQLISGPGKLLTLNTQQLKEFHIADFETSSIWEAPLFKEIPTKEVVVFEHWKLDFYSFLTHPLVASLLSIGLMLGIYLEIQSPGLIAPLILAGACFGLLILSRFALETVHLLEMIALGSGLILLFLELFVFPTMGVGAVIALVLTVGGLISIMTPHFDSITFFPSWNLAAYAVVEKLAWVCLFIIAAAGLFIALFPRYIRRLATADNIPLKEFEQPLLVGVIGVVVTPLRPSGKIDIEGRLYEAASQSQYIPEGSRVTVIRQEGNKLWVKS